MRLLGAAAAVVVALAVSACAKAGAKVTCGDVRKSIPSPDQLDKSASPKDVDLGDLGRLGAAVAKKVPSPTGDSFAWKLKATSAAVDICGGGVTQPPAASYRPFDEIVKLARRGYPGGPEIPPPPPTP